jgi:hypothetical protein
LWDLWRLTPGARQESQGSLGSILQARPSEGTSVAGRPASQAAAPGTRHRIMATFNPSLTRRHATIE